MKNTDELLADTFLHDTRSGFQLLEMAADPEQEFGGYSAPELLELNFFKQRVEGVRQRVEDDGLESAEGLFEGLAEFDGRFEGEAEDTVDKMAACSGVVSDYLSEYSDDSVLKVEELGEKLDEYGADVKYGGLENLELEGDYGLKMAFNTLGLNQEKHLSKDNNWWTEFKHQGDKIEAYLWDGGSGLSDEYGAEEIFEKGVGDGTGQGLYLASRIIEANGGSIEYDGALSDSGGFGLKIVLPVSTEYQNLNKEGNPPATH